MKNYGVILGQRPEDWIVGGGNIPYEIRVEDGDWRTYLPSEERQYSRNADTMACVSFSLLNCVEMQMKFHGVDINLSDRFLAKQSNTTTEGNYLWRVADTLRKQGNVEEQYWQAPKDFTWESYYTEIPLPIRNEAALLLNKWDFAYEFLSDLSYTSLAKELKHAPLQVVIPGHAVALVACEEDLAHYFDSYPPYNKEYASPFQAALKFVVTPKTKTMSETEVKNLYKLAFYRLPDATELAFWVGKSLSEFLTTAIKDRAAFLANQ